MSWPWESKAAVDERFHAQHPTIFTVTRWDRCKGHSFDVVNFFDKAAVMQVNTAHLGNGNLRSLVLCDPKSQVPWLAVEESRFGTAGERRWEAFRGSEMRGTDRLFVAVDKTRFFHWGTTVHVFLDGDSSDERVPDFVVHGGYYLGALTVSRGGEFVGQVRNERWWGASLAGEKRYTVTIKPDIDQAFLLALTVILDQMHSPRTDQ